MKYYYFLTLVLLLCFAGVSAQVVEVTTEVINPKGLLLHGNELYIAESGPGRISKIDISDPNAMPSIVIDGLNEPRELALIGDDLYIAEWFFSANGRISKFDITATNPSVVEVFSGIVPSGLTASGDFLFFGDTGNDKIVKIDVTVPNPSAIDVVNLSSNPESLFVHENTLYIGESGQKVSKIDVTVPNPVLTEIITGVASPRSLAIFDDELYIGESTMARIIKIDPEDTNPTPIVVVEDLVNPEGMAFNQGELYFSEFLGNRISKFVVEPLSVNSFEKSSTFTIYPNPADDYITVSGLKRPTKYYIFSAIGMKVYSGYLSKNIKIDTTSLLSGLYFLELEDGIVLKFIKN
ncbi:T9SS type A sorting domain-containing protein [Jejudonia soesokkakensis]|uniref:T9SS type A sorting domain-containing protein n=1 Tax=Jejudonia soesokkakensis TaxID=1323432 RepID=A0ABW2MVD0_9FLAO